MNSEQTNPRISRREGFKKKGHLQVFNLNTRRFEDYQPPRIRHIDPPVSSQDSSSSSQIHPDFKYNELMPIIQGPSANRPNFQQNYPNPLSVPPVHNKPDSELSNIKNVPETNPQHSYGDEALNYYKQFFKKNPHLEDHPGTSGS